MANYEKSLSEAHRLADKREYGKALDKATQAREELRRENRSSLDYFQAITGWYNKIPPGKGYAYIAMRIAEQDPDQFHNIGEAYGYARGIFEEVQMDLVSKYRAADRLPFLERKFLSSAAYTIARVCNEIANRLDEVGSPNASIVRRSSDEMNQIANDYEHG